MALRHCEASPKSEVEPLYDCFLPGAAELLQAQWQLS